ncbi:MAG: histidinol-phosphate aminotransferase family protein, partial [Oscillospiraceae bacterium]|nr:histidinol-phosphate aminotransferase family protein [Oscillospiraceae bacterium]
MKPFKLNEKISGLTPYDPISGDYPIRLDANESFLDLPEDTRSDMLGRIAALPLNRYPDHKAAEICRLFADFVGVSPGQVMAGNGLDEVLSVIIQSFLMKGDAMLTVAGDFSMYRFYCGLTEGRMVTEKRDENGAFSAEGIIESIQKNDVRLFVFSNPCNPFSTGVSAGDVLRIIDSCPDCMVVCDEAYMDFWDQSIIPAVSRYSNLILLKTCSKAYRMAGIRCGFAISCPQITRVLRAVKSPYNVSSLTQAAAAAILSRPDELRGAI